MAEDLYSAKTALYIGIIQILCGIISIAIGAINTRKEDHRAFITFKSEGLPVWSGIMFTITGGVGCLSYRNPRKLTINIFLVFCLLTIITAILMYWMLVPVFLSADKSMSWNLFFGSFLGVVAISFVVSMKGSFVSFKASIFQHNCWNRPPHRQQRNPPASAITSISVLTEDEHVESRDRRRTSRTESHLLHVPRHHSERHHRSRGYQSGQRETLRETPRSRHDERPPPPPYQTIKMPHLPGYHEITTSPAPPPYSEKVDDS